MGVPCRTGLLTGVLAVVLSWGAASTMGAGQPEQPIVKKNLVRRNVEQKNKDDGDQNDKNDGQQNNNDDGQKNNKDDGQKNNNDDGQKNDKDDGQMNNKDDGQKNNNDDGQKNDNDNGNGNDRNNVGQKLKQEKMPNVQLVGQKVGKKENPVVAQKGSAMGQGNNDKNKLVVAPKGSAKGQGNTEKVVQKLRNDASQKKEPTMPAGKTEKMQPRKNVADEKSQETVVAGSRVHGRKEQPLIAKNAGFARGVVGSGSGDRTRKEQHGAAPPSKVRVEVPGNLLKRQQGQAGFARGLKNAPPAGPIVMVQKHNGAPAQKPPQLGKVAQPTMFASKGGPRRR